MYTISLGFNLINIYIYTHTYAILQAFYDVTTTSLSIRHCSQTLFSVQGMDNFGGMNNMERFGSSGMGRMNGEETRRAHRRRRGTLSRFAGCF